MKYIFHILAILIVCVFPLDGASTSDSVPTNGTLILTGGIVTFKSSEGDQKYNWERLPAIKVTDYQKKSKEHLGKSIDVSELTLEMSDGSKLVLVEQIALKVTQIKTGKGDADIVWKMVPFTTR